MYFAFISIFIFVGQENHYFLVVMSLFAAFMLYLEFIQMTIVGLGDYLGSIFNWLDISSFSSIIVYCLVWIFTNKSYTYILLFSVFFAGLRAVTQLRCYDNTRWLIEMIIQVFIDMKAFLVLMFMINYVFALLYQIYQ